MGKTGRRSTVPWRSYCPIACTLDLVGDRWSLLIVRDLLTGKKRYGEFLESPEKIPTNILAERLKHLESAGIIKRKLYSWHPPRAEYHLTAKGRGLASVLQAMYAWAIKHLPQVRKSS